MRNFIGTILTGLVAVFFLVSEWSFAGRARVGQATVMGETNGGVVWVPGRSGRTIADVILEVDGEPRMATLRAWYCRFGAGQQVQVLYLPSDPRDVVPDQFWQCHFGSVIASVVFGLVAVGEALKSTSQRRRPTSLLLRD